MGLEVLIREGTSLVIHPDQVRQWKNAGLDIEREFVKLQNMLAPVLQTVSTSGPGASSTSAPDAAAIVEADADEEEAPADAEPANESTVTFESLEKLEASDKVTLRVGSGIAGLELLLTEGEKVYLLADKAKVIPRHSILGGFGAGKLLDLEPLHFPRLFVPF